jgi:HD-like signal output (HDOD) protein
MISQSYANSDLLRALWALDMVGKKPEDFLAPQDMRSRICTLEQLPPLSEVGRRILELKSDANSNARKLAEVIELDPVLTAQVIRWAGSALFGRRGKMPTVKDAIAVVLGYDQVINLAFALCCLTPLEVPLEGELGKRFFWRQTLAGTALLKKMLPAVRTGDPLDLSDAQLIYLMHNTGHFLLAHLFRNEFNYLSRLIAANPQSVLISLERFVLGVDHGQLGAWLMQGWGLPEALQTVVRHHHNPYYQGEHEVLVWLTCLVDRILGKAGIGDACQTPLKDTPLLINLGVGSGMIDDCVAYVRENKDEFEMAVTSLL